ncbi:TPA: cation diffusion facilitator family transporter [Enterococcus faecalis]
METKKSSGMFAVIAALIANILVAISKFVGFALSGSTAMMNESIHSVVDCSNQVLLLFGNKRASRGQSALHQFGEGRAKYFFSTIVATMLFFGGGALGVMEAIQKLLHPSHEVENVAIVIGILIFGLLVEGSSLRVAMKEIKELNTEKLSLLKFLRESRHSEILIIFTEDFCAVIGLCLALVGTLLTMVTGIAAFDRADVEKLIDVKTVHLGPTEILVAAKIDVVEPMEEDAPDVVNAIERDIRSKMPDKKIYIYIEVDDYDVNYVRK